MTTTEHFSKVIEDEPWAAGLWYYNSRDEIHWPCVYIRVVGDKIVVMRYETGRYQDRPNIRTHEQLELCDPESLIKLEHHVCCARDHDAKIKASTKCQLP